jgi:hypothetical protein
VQKDQPLAVKLVLIPILLLVFGGMGFMAADATRWRWSIMPPHVQWAGCGLLLAAFFYFAGTSLVLAAAAVAMGFKSRVCHASDTPAAHTIGSNLP